MTKNQPITQEKAYSAKMPQETVQTIRDLEARIDKNIQNTNDISRLMQYLNETEYKSDLVIAAMQSLRRVFTKVIDKNYLRPKYLNASSKLNEAVEKFRLWLLSNYKSYYETLLDLMDSEDSVTQLTAFRIVISFCQKGGYGSKESTFVFDDNLFTMIIAKLMSYAELPDQLRLCLKEEYFQYTDFKFYTYRTLYNLSVKNGGTSQSTDDAPADTEPMEEDIEVKDLSPEDFVKRAFYLLSLVDKPIDEEVKIMGIFAEKNHSESAQKKNYQTLIMSLLRHELSENLIQYVLMKVHSEILPYLQMPIQMADYLTDCFDYGGMISVLALSGLFELITKYNINYPNYYNKLYQLLTPEAFQLKYKQRFLTLLVQSLRSSAVPSVVVAAFCKRLCRIAITDSPSTALFVIPLITELITYHSVCYSLLHVDDEEDIYDVVGHRKALPGVEEEEMNVIKKKTMDLEGDDNDDDSESESEENKDEEVVAEKADNQMMKVERSTMVLSSEIVKRTLDRMKLKREQRRHELELPVKRMKQTVEFNHLKDVDWSAFDPFDNTTNDINQSHAMESYLWELSVLMNHYDPNVVEMMKKLRVKLVRVRQQFNTVVNVTYESEFSRLLKDENNRFAFTVKGSQFLRKDGIMEKLYV